MNELTMSLRTESKMPLYEQIYRYIKTSIQSGQISYGEKLPSTRALSKHLEVSRSTVELAYEQLLSEGYIEAVPCRGFFVAQIDGLFHITAKKPALKEEKKKEKTYRFDFTPNGVDLGSFPYRVWRKLSRDILMDDRTELFRSGDSKGEYGFRAAICNYLYQARGVNCDPKQVIVGAGSDYILMLLAMLLGTEHTIAFEDPTYKQAYRLLRCLHYRIAPVSMDKSGMKVSELRKTGAAIAYVTPSHQYPTGIIMPVKRRMELLKWAEEEEGRYIIEDDYDSEFRYKGKPIPALKSSDREDKVIYLGTFSKSIAPAIRLSYMVLPEKLIRKYDEQNYFINTTVSKVDQLIVQRFMEEGYYERHLNKIRAMYKGRHDRLIESLKPLMAVCDLSGENAGVHLLLTFRGRMREEALIQKAAEKRIRVYGLSDYRIQKKEEPATIILGYANLTEHQLQEAASLLVQSWM